MMSIRSRSRRMPELPSKLALERRRSGIRSLARSVDNCCQVKSSVNHPVSSRPSTFLVVRSAENSGADRDVCRAGDLVLVPQDENAVFRRDDVGLDGVSTEGECKLVR